MDLFKTSFSEDPNVGLYGLASNSYCIIGPDLSSKKKEKIEETLNTDLIQTRVDGTVLPGIFLAGNEDFLLVPASMKRRERENLKRLNVDVIELETKFNAFGNNILIGNGKILVNPKFEESTIKKIRKETGCEVLRHKLAGTGIVGANSIIIREKGLLNPVVPERELKEIGKILKVEFDYGTVNFGSGFLKSGVIINEEGVIIGDRSTGPEISRIIEHLEDE